MTMTDTERRALYAMLSATPNKTPDQARVIAQTILLSHLDRLELDVRNELTRLAVEAEQARDYASRMYYPFLTPPSEPELISSTENADYFSPAQRQEVRVQARHLKEFCKANGLREAEMAKVGMGETEEHRGWIRHSGYGGPMELGQPFRHPRPQAPARSVDVPRSKETAFRFAPPRVDWTPADK